LDNFFQFVWLGTAVVYCVSCLLTKARKEFVFCKTIRTTFVVVKYIGQLSQSGFFKETPRNFMKPHFF